jgi:hypothetical protein
MEKIEENIGYVGQLWWHNSKNLPCHPKVEDLSPYTSIDTGMEKIEETQVNFFACYVGTVVKHLPRLPKVEDLSPDTTNSAGMKKVEKNIGEPCDQQL